MKPLFAINNLSGISVDSPTPFPVFACPFSKRELWYVRVQDIEKADYNRDPNEVRAEDASDKFDWLFFGFPEVVLRDDGKLYINDGQHRDMMVSRRCPETPFLVCITRNLTIAQEANKFLVQQDSIPFTHQNKFKARVMAERPDALEIVRAVQSAGFALNYANRDRATWNVLTNTQLVERVYKKIGADGLRSALLLCQHCWQDNEEALSDTFLRGVAEFIRRYSEDPAFEFSRLVERLQKHPPQVFIDGGRGRKLKDPGNTTLAVFVATELAVKFNDAGKPKLHKNE